MSCKVKQSHNNKLTRSNTDLDMIENYKNKILSNEGYKYYSMNGYGIERTQFDIDMKRKWNSETCGSSGPSGPSGPSESSYESYSTFPYGLERSKFDKQMINKWDTEEHYIGPRTQFDKNLQKKWAPGCPSCPCYQPEKKCTKEDFNDYLMSFDDTDNKWSYCTKDL
jgi:hypothetical protein